MPTGPFGFSRDIPLAGESGGPTGGGPSTPKGLSPQEAVKLISLRVPERSSAGALAPLPLLTSRGSQQAGAGGLDTLIAALMQAFKGSTLPSGPDTTSGWMNRERGLGQPTSTSDEQNPRYDAGTGFNPIPRRDPSGALGNTPMNNTPGAELPARIPSSPGPPRIGPSDRAPDPTGSIDVPRQPEPAPSLFDNNQGWTDWRVNKYDMPLDINGLY